MLPPQIFQAAGFADAGDATRVALVLGGFKLVMTIVAVTTVDSWGRRPLLLWGVGGIVVSLLVLATASLEGGPLPVEFAAWTNLLALLAYVGSYQVSVGLGACGVGAWGSFGGCGCMRDGCCMKSTVPVTSSSRGFCSPCPTTPRPCR